MEAVDDGSGEKIDQISCDSYNRLQLFMRQIKVNNGSEYWSYRVLWPVDIVLSVRIVVSREKSGLHHPVATAEDYLSLTS